jgi:hypothetical protein
VYDCAPRSTDIRAAIERALATDCKDAINPYGDGHSAQRIVGHLAAVKDFPSLVQKRFHDLGA